MSRKPHNIKVPKTDFFIEDRLTIVFCDHTSVFALSSKISNKINRIYSYILDKDYIRYFCIVN